MPFQTKMLPKVESKLPIVVAGILTFLAVTVVAFSLWCLLFAAIARADTPTIQIYTKSPSPSYSYVPALLQDAQKTRMYWCGSNSSLPGDHIFYAESNGISGPFSAKGSSIPNTFTVSLSPSASGFDSSHTCDPSVVRDPVSGTRYLYYGGIKEIPGDRTAIGVASSANGVTGYTRLNGGKAILASHPQVTSLTGYGTGQPSVFIRNGLYYVIYTDHFGKNSNTVNGAGQYVVRSPDPTFQSGVEALGASGFIKLEDLFGRPEPYERYLLRTQRALFQGFSVDWGYNSTTGHVVVAGHGTQGQAYLVTFDPDTFGQLSIQEVHYTKSWADGPGILKNSQGEIVCPVVLYGSFGDSVWTSQLNLQATGLCP